MGRIIGIIPTKPDNKGKEQDKKPVPKPVKKQTAK